MQRRRAAARVPVPARDWWGWEAVLVKVWGPLWGWELQRVRKCGHPIGRGQWDLKNVCSVRGDQPPCTTTTAKNTRSQGPGQGAGTQL